MNDDLDSQDAFAFSIELGGQFTEMGLKDRHVILRCLDHNLQSRHFFAFTPGWAFLGAKDGFEYFDVEFSACSINHTMENLIQIATAFKQQIATILSLINRILILETTTLLLQRTQGKTQTGRINPTLTHLFQVPYSLRLRQGICNFP